MKTALAIKILRGKQSQQAFATELGISIRALAGYELGERSPDWIRCLYLLAMAAKRGRSELIPALREPLSELSDHQLSALAHGIAAELESRHIPTAPPAP